MELTPRKGKILSSVVREYVESGEPVGSKSIAEEIGVSSATVRNEMAELIDLGLLEQPHTSAGRVPSQKGYRVYVDRLMDHWGLDAEEKRVLDSVLTGSSYDPEQLLREVTQLLSSLTRCCAVAATPGGRSAVINAVQFVQTSRRTAMLILISSAGTMKTRVFHCDFDLSGEIMRMFFRVINEKVSGKAVSEITPAFLQSLAVSLGELTVLMSAPLLALLETAHDTVKTELFLSGQMNLLLYPELDLLNARGILDFLERKDQLAELLSLRPGRVTVRIGREIGRAELSGSALIASRYTVDGTDAGALAVLGPVRLDYGRIIVLVDYLSHKVSSMLTLLTQDE